MVLKEKFNIKMYFMMFLHISFTKQDFYNKQFCINIISFDSKYIHIANNLYFVSLF